MSAVTDRGRLTLLNFCRTCEWLILADILLNPAGAVVSIHSSCRKRFTRLTTSDICDTDTSDYSQTKQLHSADDMFNWKKSCFLCKDDVDFERDQNRARRVGTLELRTAILHHCSERADTWAIEVQGRMESCCDLVAEEAVYHCTCYAVFTSQRSLNGQGQHGRPEDAEMQKAFDELCDLVEDSCELLTLDDLRQHDFLTTEGIPEASAQVYSTKHLKAKLLEKYGDHIYFAEVCGRKKRGMFPASVFIHYQRHMVQAAE